MKIERNQLEQVGEYLRGTCKSIGEAIDALELGDDVDESQLEADLLEVDTELCVHCSWWHEVCELQYSEEHGGGLCEQCCDELGVEFD
ncbi:hypothetical protein ACR3H8_20210 [Pseudomonas aeruginosa]|uniref:hypothetical protein n=1 Tax=Pseudomonas aeruginosa TaxID=287 RepID=UPI000E328543|nr:hypothetical protein [Pseudomonas aeruginosa]MCC0301122.1 hypothetical protein [Pseudomonas aeruginosa]MCC0408521.1 hypothetical protein [Pseudomonas aeruginosa]MCC0433663.1 hypothetical protein [Pseudomonas aeruginosa]MCT5450503.1 hypothetical protein [Pseudomonas aeruginosa]NQC65606.1 hypothetical protein [Pseudomonas aeruginosa]